MENTFIRSNQNQQVQQSQATAQNVPQTNTPKTQKNYQDIAIKKSVVNALVKESHVGWEYILMLLLSVLITTLGLIEGSASVVIGGMLLTPLMSPILALGLSLITTNKDSTFRSGINILKSIGIILAASTATAFLFGVGYDFHNNFEVITRAEPSLLFMYIAILSGIGAAFTWAKPHLSARLPGIAVAVALVPPLCVTGIGISSLNYEMVVGSFQMFLVNILGITGTSAVVFASLGFYQMKYVEQEAITTEKVIEEQKKAESEQQSTNQQQQYPQQQ